MIELIEVKKACNTILRDLYPGMKIYGSDTAEALERPCFYTEIIPYVLNYESINRVRQSCGFKISYLENETNEESCLKLFAKVRQAFGLKLPVNDRRITISDIGFELTGSHNDVFQITITFEWYDSITEAEDIPVMTDVTYGSRIERI